MEQAITAPAMTTRRVISTSLQLLRHVVSGKGISVIIHPEVACDMPPRRNSGNPKPMKQRLLIATARAPRSGSRNSPMLLINGKIVTGGALFSIQHTVFVREGKIAAVGRR